jgi:hypothetical protein
MTSAAFFVLGIGAALSLGMIILGWAIGKFIQCVDHETSIHTISATPSQPQPRHPSL